MSAIIDALDRMDFWSRELVLRYQPHVVDAEEDTDFHPTILKEKSDRIKTSIAVSQFQAAQEAAREAQL